MDLAFGQTPGQSFKVPPPAAPSVTKWLPSSSTSIYAWNNRVSIKNPQDGEMNCEIVSLRHTQEPPQLTYS